MSKFCHIFIFVHKQSHSHAKESGNEAVVGVDYHLELLKLKMMHVQNIV